MSATPIVERIRKAYRSGIDYHEMMREVFPPDMYPKAWNYRAKGGPPGCAMAFAKGLQRAGLMVLWERDARKVYRSKEPTR